MDFYRSHRWMSFRNAPAEALLNLGCLTYLIRPSADILLRFSYCMLKLRARPSASLARSMIAFQFQILFCSIAAFLTAPCYPSACWIYWRSGAVHRYNNCSTRILILQWLVAQLLMSWRVMARVSELVVVQHGVTLFRLLQN